VVATSVKHSDIREWRLAQLDRQGGVCPLCGLPCDPTESALDHDHTTGHVRQTLHRSCNSAEGKILHWAGQRSKGDDPAEFITNLLEYWQVDYTNNPVHPTHGKPKRRKRRKR
jgi:hypothetical protein